MSDISRRQKKKLAAEGAEALKRKPGWDPAQFKQASAQEQMAELNQAARSQDVYEKQGSCDDCVAAQQASGDATALCEQHLREAMGF